MTLNQPGNFLDQFGSDDLQMPELKLIQNTGGENAKAQGAKPGDLVLTLTDARTTPDVGVDIVIVSIQKIRTYWGRDTLENEPPICSSNAAGTYKSDKGEDCHSCKHLCEQPWLLSAAERRQKCTVSYIIFGINVADNMPMMLRCGGVSTGAVRELNTLLKTNSTIRGRFFHKVSIHVTSEAVKGPSGTVFAFKFTTPKLINNAEQEAFLAELSASLRGQTAIPAAPTNVEIPQTASPENPVTKASDVNLEF